MDQITNDTIIKIILEKGVRECAHWLQTISPEHNLRSLDCACSKILKTYKSLNKSISRPGGSEKMTLYRNGHFDWPIKRDLSINRKTDLLAPEPDLAKKICLFQHARNLFYCN